MRRIIWWGFVYLVCLEVALQGFYYVKAGDFLFRRTGIPIYAREAHTGFGNRPGLSYEHRTNEFQAHYYISQAGFRVPRPDVKYALAKPADVYRVMILGPSFAFGWGVNYELSFAGVLQQLLSERRLANDKKIEIINAGVPAMPLAPQLTWFEHVGKDYAPDLVIQFVHGSMVYEENTQPLAAVDDDGYLVPLQADTVQRWREKFKKLATVFYGWMLWTNFNSGSRGVLGAGREVAAPITFDPTHPKIRGALNFYNKLASVVSQTGARLLVVYVPLSYAVHREDESRWRLLGILDIPAQTALDAAFVRYLNESQIPSIDLGQQFRKSALDGKRLYYWLDIHWTPAGNAAAALAVADHLVGPP